MEVELVPKAPKNPSSAIRFIAKYLSTAHAPVWSQRPRAQMLDMESSLKGAYYRFAASRPQPYFYVRQPRSNTKTVFRNDFLAATVFRIQNMAECA